MKPDPADPSSAMPSGGAATAGPLCLETSLLGPLLVPHGAGRAAELEELSARATQYATRARGDGTRWAYRSARQGFAAWCHGLGREPLAGDADTIAMYVVRRADDGLAVSTLRVHLAAIRTAHLLAGVPLDLRHPRLAMVLEGITRSKGTRPRPAMCRLCLTWPGCGSMGFREACGLSNRSRAASGIEGRGFLPTTWPPVAHGTGGTFIMLAGIDPVCRRHDPCDTATSDGPSRHKPSTARPHIASPTRIANALTLTAIGRLPKVCARSGQKGEADAAPDSLV